MLSRRALSIAAAITLGAAGALTALPGAVQAVAASEEAKIVPAPSVKSKETGKTRVAIFAGGCFWGVEGVFSHIKGVSSVVSGYHGDSKAKASYDLVSYGTTRHAEVVKVVYDPAVVRYDQLLQVFFSVVTDPTQLNRQGPDRGSQYRNALVPMDKQQASVARAYIAQLGKAKLWPAPIVTKIEAYSGFYPAETYHQDFMVKNPDHPYIRRWDQPKVANFKQNFPGLARKSAIRG